jgi:molybdenum cofactor cytidylyltransferase
MPETWGIILAAGESVRVKGGKLLLPFRGMTIVEWVFEQASLSELDHCLVVLGAYRDEIMALKGMKKAKLCFNERYHEGMLSSVVCGLRSLPESAEAAIIMLADQPAITGLVINQLIRSYIESGKGLILPVFQGKRGHPLLLDRKYFAEVEKLGPSSGLRSLLDMHPDDLLEQEVADQSVLRDIDTVEDYIREIKQNR